MIDKTKVAIRASTQDHLDIAGIQDDLLLLKDGGACLVLQTKAVNFGLLSEREQDATIYAYAALLNSLTFAIQIVIRSQKKDISEYLLLLDRTAQKEKKTLIKNQIVKYRQFVKETVQKNNVLDKNFFIVIPMMALELGLGKKKTFDQKNLLAKAKVNLYPKRDHLLRLLGRLGLSAKQLNTGELINLFFNIYNPQTLTQPGQYQTPLVQAASQTKPVTKPTPVAPEPTAGPLPEAVQPVAASPLPTTLAKPVSPPTVSVAQARDIASPLASAASPAPPERVVVSTEPDLQSQIDGLVKESLP